LYPSFDDNKWINVKELNVVNGISNVENAGKVNETGLLMVVNGNISNKVGDHH
jgi:hypothetical protein